MKGLVCARTNHVVAVTIRAAKAGATGDAKGDLLVLVLRINRRQRNARVYPT
jgi:hypothetical protein